MKIAGWLLILIAAVLFVSAALDTREEAQAAPQRLSEDFAVLNGKTVLETDKLDIENAQLQQKIDHAHGKRNDGTAVAQARVKLIKDEETYEAALTAQAAQPPSKTNTEMIRSIAAGICGLLGLLFIYLGYRRNALTSASKASASTAPYLP